MITYKILFECDAPKCGILPIEKLYVYKMGSKQRELELPHDWRQVGKLVICHMHSISVDGEVVRTL